MKPSPCHDCIADLYDCLTAIGGWAKRGDIEQTRKAVVMLEKCLDRMCLRQITSKGPRYERQVG